MRGSRNEKRLRRGSNPLIPGITTALCAHNLNELDRAPGDSCAAGNRDPWGPVMLTTDRTDRLTGRLDRPTRCQPDRGRSTC